MNYTLLKELIENPGSSVCKDPSGSELFANNAPPDVTSAKERHDVIPGRGDLRISLTSACNLKCSYCHNEGQEVPWLHHTTTWVTLGDIEELLDAASKYGAKSVKFSGGDPGVYPGLLKLPERVGVWRERYPGIEKWGMCTNGGHSSTRRSSRP